MLIAVPSAKKTIDDEVNPSFGRSSYFLLVNDNDFNFEVMDNQAIHAQGGAGIIAAQAIVDSKADVVITYRCGQNAADVLQAAGIKTYKAVAGTVKENINKYNDGKLEE